jgi:hypothetical protein
MTLLADGSLSQPWSMLVTDQVFLVTGCHAPLRAAQPAAVGVVAWSTVAAQLARTFSASADGVPGSAV